MLNDTILGRVLTLCETRLDRDRMSVRGQCRMDRWSQRYIYTLTVDPSVIAYSGKHW